MTMLAVLKLGSRGPDVERIQIFLRGLGLYLGNCDGEFGEKTKAAVVAYQNDRELCPDGVVGNRTWGAFMRDGIPVLPSQDSDDLREGSNWPPKPSDLRPLTAVEKMAAFGRFEFVHSPNENNPEAVTITKREADFKIVKVAIPQLVGVAGFPKNGEIFFEESGVEQLQGLVAAWEKEGLLRRILSWAGTYDLRFVRGSRTTLSSHAWATAFDINVQWNGLGAEPALVGRKGSVRELVPLANEFGFYWGGHFRRLDGMHLELARVG